MAVVGLGMDLCSISRIRAIVAGPRGERFVDRVYTAAERTLCEGRADSAPGFAARFAAKEALMKALGTPPGLRWKDIEVVRSPHTAPTFNLSGLALKEMQSRRLTLWLTLTHDADTAGATVIAEGTI